MTRAASSGSDTPRASVVRAQPRPNESEQQTTVTTLSTDSVTTVDFWFDPGCPYTWRTSRWLVDVIGQRPIDVTWHLMSLSVLNEDKDVPKHYRAMVENNIRVLRVFAAAEQTGGQQALTALYTAFGARRWDDGIDYDDDLMRATITGAGLPESLADALDDESYDAVIRPSHDESQARVGDASGSPVTAINDGKAYFGPVVVPTPTGDDALRLFDALRLLSTVPAFSELKGSRAEL